MPMVFWAFIQLESTLASMSPLTFPNQFSVLIGGFIPRIALSQLNRLLPHKLLHTIIIFHVRIIKRKPNMLDSCGKFHHNRTNSWFVVDHCLCIDHPTITVWYLPEDGCVKIYFQPISAAEYLMTGEDSNQMNI